jgi:hypothetical protein
VTGDELKALSSTLRPTPLVQLGRRPRDQLHPHIISNSNNTIHHNEAAMSGSQFLPFLTAFASTGQVSSLFDQNKIYLEATATANQMMIFSGLVQQRWAN